MSPAAVILRRWDRIAHAQLVEHAARGLILATDTDALAEKLAFRMAGGAHG